MNYFGQDIRDVGMRASLQQPAFQPTGQDEEIFGVKQISLTLLKSSLCLT